MCGGGSGVEGGGQEGGAAALGFVAFSSLLCRYLFFCCVKVGSVCFSVVSFFIFYVYIFFTFFICVCMCVRALSIRHCIFSCFLFFFLEWKVRFRSRDVSSVPRNFYRYSCARSLFHPLLHPSFFFSRLASIFFRFSYLLLLHGLVDVRHGSESRPFFSRKRLNAGKSSPPPLPTVRPHHASRPGWRGPPLDTCDARGLGQGRKAIGCGGDFTSHRGGNAARVAPPSVGIGYYPRPILLPGFGAWASMPAVLRATKSREGRRTRDWFHVPCDGSGV